MPYQIRYTILTASGSTLETPAPTYKSSASPPRYGDTTQLFLAVRLNCNKCHDHPFERWTQDQYYNVGFLAQVHARRIHTSRPKIGAAPSKDGLAPSDRSECEVRDVKHDRTGKVTPPYSVQTQRPGPATASRREQLAKWVTSKETHTFPQLRHASGALSASALLSRSTTSAATRHPTPSSSTA